MNLNDYVKFDDSRKQFEIVTGTQGKYSYDDVTRVSVLNEKAKYKGKGIPLSATYILYYIYPTSHNISYVIFIELKIEQIFK